MVFAAGDVSPEIALPEEAAAQEEEKMLVEDSAPEPEKAASEVDNIQYQFLLSIPVKAMKRIRK